MDTYLLGLRLQGRRVVNVHEVNELFARTDTNRHTRKGSLHQ